MANNLKANNNVTDFTAQSRADNKAVGFINLTLPAANGGRADKLGGYGITLREGNATEAKLAEVLASLAGNPEKQREVIVTFLSRLHIDFNLNQKKAVDNSILDFTDILGEEPVPAQDPLDGVFGNRS